MAVKVCINKEVVSYDMVQHRVAVLEIVEDTQNGAVAIVRRQWSQAEIFQGDRFALVCGFKRLNVKLQIQYLVRRKRRTG